MDFDAVKNILNKKPFRPLRFHLADGSKCDVEHRGNVVILDDVWLLHIYTDSDEPDVMKDWIAVAPDHIVKAEFIKSAHKGNGKMKK